MWQVVIIVIVIAMMVGPICMMRPSGRDAREAKQRDKARELGLSVYLSKLPSESSIQHAKTYAIYSLAWPEKKLKNNDNVLKWTLEQKKYEHAIHFHGRWDWFGDRKAPEENYASLRDFLNDMPLGVAALASTQSGLGVYWDESLSEETPEQAVNIIYKKLYDLMCAITM